MNILDKGFVKLVDHMGDDLSVVNAARVSFGKKKEQFDNRDKRLIKYLWEHKHTSPFRHASLQFHIKAPIFVLRQWMKHQVGCSWNEISGRYVEFDYDYHEPSVFRLQSKDNKQGSEGSLSKSENQMAQNVFNQSCKNAFESYELLLKMGVCKEQARMVLPLNLYSECYWTCSLQAVLHFINLRDESHAQWEIQEYARAVKELIKPLFPHTLELFDGGVQ